MTKPSQISEVKRFCEVLTNVVIACKDLRVELSELESMLGADNLELKVLRKLSNSKKKYIGYMLDTKATGLEIVKNLNAIIEQRAADTQLAHGMEDAIEVLKSIGIPVLTKDGYLSKTVRIKLIYSVVCKTKNGSTQFQETHRESLERL